MFVASPEKVDQIIDDSEACKALWVGTAAGIAVFGKILDVLEE